MAVEERGETTVFGMGERVGVDTQRKVGTVVVGERGRGGWQFVQGDARGGGGGGGGGGGEESGRVGAGGVKVRGIGVLKCEGEDVGVPFDGLR